MPTEIMLKGIIELILLWAVLFFAGIKYLADREEETSTSSPDWEGFKKRYPPPEPDYFGFPEKPFVYVSVFERVHVPEEEKKPAPKKTKFQQIFSFLKTLLTVFGALICIAGAIIIVPMFGILFFLRGCLAFVLLICLGIYEVFLNILKESKSTSAWAKERLEFLRDLDF
jgi:hypothetical protein